LEGSARLILTPPRCDGLPEGFSRVFTGGGEPVAWVFTENLTAPSGRKVLAQTSADETSFRFPLCVYDLLAVKDVEVALSFKAV
jgi:hypothetical protein